MRECLNISVRTSVASFIIAGGQRLDTNKLLIQIKF